MSGTFRIKPRFFKLGLLLVAVAVSGAACRRDMQDQPRYEPLGGSSFFEDHRQARPLPAGTVARGHLKEDAYFHRGVTADGRPAPAFPMRISAEILERGRERYAIYCTPCHGETGAGNGMIVQRGFPKPVSFHDARLAEEAPGYYFNVISNGFGVMPSYAAQVPAGDRWAIIAYIRALQLSQHATLADIPPAERVRLNRPESAAAPAEQEGAGHD